MPISCFIIISVLFMNGYLVILTVAPKLYINTVSLSTKRLKFAVRLSSDQIGITAFRKQQAVLGLGVTDR